MEPHCDAVCLDSASGLIGQVWAILCPLINLSILWRLCFGRRDMA